MDHIDEKIRLEFEDLKDFLNSVGIITETVPRGGGFDAETMLVCLPSVHGLPDMTEDMEEGSLHLASACFLLPDEGEKEPAITKYLSFYSQIHASLNGMDETDILRLINRMNRTVRIGHYFYGEVSGEENRMIQYRAMVSGDAQEPLDGGLVADAVFEMGVAYDLMLEAVEQERASAVQD